MNESAKIPFPRMIVLGLGFFGTQIVWAFHSASMPLFLNGFTDSKFKISLVLSLAGVMGCIAPPIVGHLSDRIFTMFGRRKPYIFFGMLCMSLCVASLPHLPVYGIVAMVSALMYLALVSGEAPYMALLPDTVPPEQRSTASGVMNLLGSVGLIAYYILGTAVWDTHRTAVFYTVGLLPFALMLVTIALIKEPDVLQEKPNEESNPLLYLKELVKEKNAMIFFIGQAFWWLALWMFTSFLTLFLVEVLGVSEGKSMLASLTFSLVSILVMLPLGMLGDRLGRKGILTSMLALWAVVYVLMGLAQNVLHVLILAGLAGIPFAAIRGVGYAYMLDLIPEERTAEFVGFNYLSQTLSLVFGALSGGLLIDSLGYRSIFAAAGIFTVVGLLILQWVQPRGKQQ